MCIIVSVKSGEIKYNHPKIQTDEHHLAEIKYLIKQEKMLAFGNSSSQEWLTQIQIFEYSST